MQNGFQVTQTEGAKLFALFQSSAFLYSNIRQQGDYASQPDKARCLAELNALITDARLDPKMANQMLQAAAMSLGLELRHHEGNFMPVNRPLLFDVVSRAAR